MKHLSFAMFALFLSAGAASSADAPPKAAVDACLKHADAYSGATAGTATFQGDAQANVPWFGGGAGDNWKLRIDGGAGGVSVWCTVSTDGKKVALEPIG